MKLIVALSIIVLSAIPIIAEDSTPKENSGISISGWNASLGLVGVAYMYPFKSKYDPIFKPSFGTFFRCTRAPYYNKDSGEDKMSYFDYGITAYVTGGTFEDKSSAIVGIGPTFGMFNSVISISVCATEVLNDKFHRAYVTIILTSNSFKF